MGGQVIAPKPPVFWRDSEQHRRQIADYLSLVGDRANGALQLEGDEPMTAPLTLSTYLTAALPAAASYPGAIIYVSDAAVGAKFQGSDGSAWVNLG